MHTSEGKFIIMQRPNISLHFIDLQTIELLDLIDKLTSAFSASKAM